MTVSAGHFSPEHVSMSTATQPPEGGSLSLGATAVGAERISVTVARGRLGLDSIRREWLDLIDCRREQVALAHATPWYDAYLATTADPERVYFFVAHRGPEVIAIFPFERSMLFVLGVPLPVWVLLYHDHMPFSDVIARPEEAAILIPPLLKALRRQGVWALLVTRNLRADSVAMAVAEHPSFEHRIMRQLGDCHYLDCGQPFENLLASFSRKHRANLRRHRSNLSTLGPLETVTVADVAGMESCFEEFLVVEGSGWKGSAGAGTAIALHPELERYYRHLLHAFGTRGQCELNLLRLNGRCVAAQFCVTISGVWYLLKIGYDEEYAKYSPGSLLLEDVLIGLCARPDVRVANLASDASWHLNWSPHSLGMADHYLGAPGLGGRIAISLVRLRMRLVREFRRLRDGMNARWSVLRGLMSRQAAADARG